MTKYLISFPSKAMTVAAEEFPSVVAASHAVIEEARAAGVYVFGGGIEERVDPVLVSGAGAVSTDIYPGSRLNGGFLVLELRAREDANGRERSRSPAAAHKNCASSWTTRRAKARSCMSGGAQR